MIYPTDIIPLVAASTIVLLLLISAFVLFFSFSQTKLRQEQLRSQALKLQHQQALLHHTFQAQEAERSRIAKDLHDDISAKLSIVHLYIEQLKKERTQTPLTQKISTVIQASMETTRRVSHNLLPPTLENFGLASAIMELTDWLALADDYRVDCRTSGQRNIAPNINTELHLFRILQEMLQNTVKHAKAQVISIHLTERPHEIVLSYQDDGIGFDVESVQEGGGLGLRSMESRLEMLGGTYSFFTAPGKGVQYEVKVPITSTVASDHKDSDYQKPVGSILTSSF